MKKYSLEAVPNNVLRFLVSRQDALRTSRELKYKLQASRNSYEKLLEENKKIRKERRLLKKYFFFFLKDFCSPDDFQNGKQLFESPELQQKFNDKMKIDFFKNPKNQNELNLSEVKNGIY